MAKRGLAIRPLPAVLPAGTDHLERAVLSSAPLDRVPAASRGHAVPLRRLPLQLRQLPQVQGAFYLASQNAGGRRFEPGRRAGVEPAAGLGGAPNGEVLCFT